MLPVLLLISVIIFLCSFKCGFRVLISMHPCYLQCWLVLFHLLFLKHIVFLCHLQKVKPYASLSVFLSFGQFVEVLISSILRMVPSIFQEGQPKCLSLWRNFSCWAWFHEGFLFVWNTLSKFFLSSTLVWCFSLPKYLQFSFFRAFWFFLNSVVLFLPLFHFSLLAWHIFYAKFYSFMLVVYSYCFY